MLANYFGSARFVYNHFLAKRKEQYEKTKKSSNFYEQAKELTAMKKTEAYSWLREINSQTLQHALRHLETAYVNFFKGRAGFPRFHSKKHGGSFAVPSILRSKPTEYLFQSSRMESSLPRAKKSKAN